MADGKRSLDIVIAAKDETEAGVKSVQSRLDALQQQLTHHVTTRGPSGSGGKTEGGGIPGLEGLGKLSEMLEGAGVVAALEGVAKALHGVAEAQEEVEKKGLTGSQAFGKLLEGATDSVPVLSQGIHLFTELRTGVQDAGAALYRLGGGTKDAAESMMSAESQTALLTAQLKEQAEAVNLLRASQEALNVSRLRGREREREELRSQVQAEADFAAQGARDFLAEHGGKLDDLSEAEKTTYKGYQQEALNAKNTAIEKLKELDERYRHEDEEREREHRATMRSIADAGESGFLGAFATARAQQSEALRDAHEAELQALHNQRDRDVAAHPDQKARIEADALDKQQQLRRKFELEDLAEQRRFDREDEDVEFQHQQKLLDIAAQAQAEKLRMIHRDAQAELVLVKRQHDREEAEAARDLELLRRSEANNPNTLGAEKELAAAQKRADSAKAVRDAEFAASEERLKRQSANDAQDRRAELQHALAKLRIDELREEAALGNQIAARQAEGLAITEKYAEKRAEINRLLRDQASILSDEEKADLQKRLAGVDKLEGIERARLGKHGAAGSPTGNFLPSDEDASHLTGAAQFAQEWMLGQADAQQKAAEATDNLVKFLNDQLGPILPQISTVLPTFGQWLTNLVNGLDTTGSTSGVF